MQPVQLSAGVHWVGVNDRTTDLFEGIWPITREGVTYNAYLVEDEACALIDPVRASKAQQFLEKLGAVCDLSRLRYLVLNHMEQDHTSSVPLLRRLVPGLTIVCTAKARDMLESFYGVTENIRVVDEGDTLSLGETTLRFFVTPFVHWPETMMTWEPERRILFSCDGFGTFGALDGALFDDQIADLAWYEGEGLRYFANVVAKFSKPVRNAISRLGGLDMAVIAPSHGPVWRSDPARIVELYDRWCGYADGPAEPEVTLLYGSMYGFTERMMGAVAEGVSEVGVPVDVFDAGRRHPSYILPSLWSRNGVLVGAPTYEGELFPPVSHALRLAAMKRPRNRLLGIFGSYGWSGGAETDVGQIVEGLDWELVEELHFAGKPTGKQLEEGRRFGRTFGEAVTRG